MWLPVTPFVNPFSTDQLTFLFHSELMDLFVVAETSQQPITAKQPG
jgi:hypothetical protein